MADPTHDPGGDPAATDPLFAARQVRERFIASFPAKCSSITLLGEAVANLGQAGPVRALRQVVHQLAGLAGTIGFPTVSERAADLEQIVVALPTVDIGRAGFAEAVKALRTAFDADLARSQADWTPPAGVRRSETVLLVDDDPEQRTLVGGWLRHAGYRTVLVAAGGEAFDTARLEQPDLVLLDVEMPGRDGYAVCRQLKASAALSSVPVMFMTTRGGVDDRVHGLTLGADDYLQKPLDPRELLVRVRRLLERAHATPPPDEGGVLTYETFLIAARDVCAREPVALALIRLPPGEAERAIRRVCDDARRKDLVGRYDRSHLVLLMPGVTARAALTRMKDNIDAIGTLDGGSVHAGVAVTTAAGEKTIDRLIGDADEALTDARYAGVAASTRTDRTRRAEAGDAVASRLAVVAEDDPDVVRILDAHLRHGGYRTMLVFDGAAAIEAAGSHRPDVLLLDLMLPKRTGFDVLAAVQGAVHRPRVVVLSARGREDDVTRAFELGADDYVTKPFNPQELMARIGRLLR